MSLFSYQHDAKRNRFSLRLFLSGLLAPSVKVIRLPGPSFHPSKSFLILPAVGFEYFNNMKIHLLMVRKKV